MELFEQVVRFRTDLFRIYNHAYRFFNIGYFLWNKSLDQKGGNEHVGLALWQDSLGESVHLEILLWCL